MGQGDVYYFFDKSLIDDAQYVKHFLKVIIELLREAREAVVIYVNDDSTDSEDEP